jgi:hypothetical protein
MSGAERRGRGFRRLAAVATLAAAALLGPAGASPAFAAEDELALASRATYTLEPEALAVRVAVAVTATNNKPDLVESTASGTRTTRYFYDGANLVIHSEATAVAARAGEADLAVRLTPEEGYTIAEVRFGRDLYFGQSLEFTLTYDLPGGAPRSDSDIRVGSAFATFYAWAFGDRGDVTIAVPAGYEVETTGATVTESSAAGATLLSATAIADVPEWFVVVVADRHDSLTRDRLDLPGGERLLIRAWPEDEEWLERVGGLLRVGLPVLVEKIGLAWPVDGEIEVAEVHTPLLEGYAGVFYTNEDLIEISEELDELTIVHEASHAWFNSDLFVGRWINEGLADEYAARVLDEVSVGGLRPRGLSPSSEGAVRLNEWSHPGRISDEETDARETFGYEASWTVIRDLVGEIGEEGMRTVFAAADGRQVAYVGASEPEAVTIQNDWRRFLDLLEEIGGSASAEELYRRWVVTTEQEAQLEERARARETYAALVDAGDGWLPGFAVRDPLGRWQFARARERIEEAGAILAIRDDIAEVADRLGIDPPGSLRAAYQGATTEEELALARAAAAEQLAVATELAATAEAVRAARDPFTAIGLIGEEPERDLEAATAAFVAGSEDRAAARAAEIRTLLDTADDTGRTRTLAGGGLVLAGGGLAAAAAVWRRRRGPAAEVAAPEVGEPAGDAPESPAALVPAEPVAPADPEPAEPAAAPEGARPYATLGGRRPSDPTEPSAAEPPTPATEPPDGREGDEHVRDGA